TEITLLLCYCSNLKQSGIPIRKSAALVNLYETQLKKINKLLPLLHEDLQYDFQREIAGL
ncbi:MAG TPA: hypothetical protein PLD84_01695, partial [Chitinophagales bacterium]|nr:hypothetical protein [Chitinophagales bacterium]